MSIVDLPTVASGLIAFEAFGVRLAVEVPAEVRQAATGILPPGWQTCPDERIDARFGLRTIEGICYEVSRDGAPLSLPHELEVALGILDASIRMEIAQRAVGWTFIHAGAVGVAGRGLVLPGLSFSGKTTLVEALIRQGAVYFSDEYALLDDAGRLHPYAKPLSMRVRGATPTTPGPTTEVRAAQVGADTGEHPLEIGLIASLAYVPGASWQPRELSPAAGALSLLAHAVTARDDPARALAAVRKAGEHALALEGDRGEADATAGILLTLAAAPDGET